MKNKLLITTALVATFYATNVWAVSYTDKVELEQGKTNYIAANSTIDSAIFDLEAVGEHVGNATRIGFKDAGTITISGDNTFRDFVTFEGNTSFTASGDTTPKMTVEGYMTSTRNADVDLSAVDVTISQGDGGSSVVQNYGGLIIDNDTTRNMILILYLKDYKFYCNQQLFLFIVYMLYFAVGMYYLDSILISVEGTSTGSQSSLYVAASKHIE